MAAAFEGLTFASITKPNGAHGTTTGTNIYLDGKLLTTLAISGTRAESSRSFTGTYNLVAGDRLDFAVSGAGDGYASDLTRLSVRSSPNRCPNPKPGGCCWPASVSSEAWRDACVAVDTSAVYLASTCRSSAPRRPFFASRSKNARNSVWSR